MNIWSITLNDLVKKCYHDEEYWKEEVLRKLDAEIFKNKKCCHCLGTGERMLPCNKCNDWKGKCWNCLGKGEYIEKCYDCRIVGRGMHPLMLESTYLFCGECGYETFNKVNQMHKETCLGYDRIIKQDETKEEERCVIT